jgi:amidase
VKPTVGRVSRTGIMPITADQDTAGPMARHVVDAAILLGALEGARPDAADPRSAACARPDDGDYTRFLDPAALRGARIGVPRAYFYDRIVPPGGRGQAGGLDAAERALMDEAIAVLARAGAVIVDPADLPSFTTPVPADNLLLWNTCSGTEGAKGRDAGCSVVLKYGMKRDFNAWLQTLGPSAPVRSLAELREWNRAHERAGAIKYGQSQLDISDEMDVEADRSRYQADRARDLRLSAAAGIDAVMRAERLDALLFPASFGAAVSARPGYPTVIVPFGFVPNAPTPPFPADFSAKAQPFGVSFAGTACTEPTLLALAYAFEQATRARVPPSSAP